jgi:polysaccharide export outer membrane protein
MKIIITILFATLLFTASGFSNVFSQEVSDFSVNSQQVEQDRYLIGPEDILEISVWKNADLSRVVIVRPDGRISLPLIGDVQAAGRTPDELRQDIVKKLQEYQETVVASVIVQEVNSYRIFMLGEIRSPGPYTLKRKTSILQAISHAGGFTEFASKNKIILIREGERIKVSFDNLVKGKSDDSELILRSGDTIFVPGGTIFLP